MTLILKLDLDMIKMYHHTKNDVSMLNHSKVIAWTYRQMDTQTLEKHYISAYAGGNNEGFCVNALQVASERK